MKRFIYAGNFGLPENATGIRVYNLACMLRKLGYEVVFVSNQKNKLGEVVYDGFHYYFDKIPAYSGTRRKIESCVEFFTKIHFFNRIKTVFYDIEGSDVIILYNDPYFLTKKMLDWKKKENFSLVSDVTEWYEHRHGKNYKITERIIPFLIDKRITCLDQKVNNIICVSPYLNRFYKQKRCSLLYLPPVFDMEYLKFNQIERFDTNQIRFIYAGSPGNKDIIKPFINAIRYCNEKKLQFRFDIIGVCAQDFGLEREKIQEKGIFFHGRLSHQETLGYIRNADFGILLRRKARYAQAGFSTKFSECMVNGVAMFCNKIEGPETIIDNCKNGILLEDYEVKTLINELKKIGQLTSDEILSLRMAAFELAIENFDRNKYLKDLERFANSL